MSKISVFLHPSAAAEKEVVISDRFKDEDGNVVPFKIKAITQEENDLISKKATKSYKENGQRYEYLDSVDYCRRLVVASTVDPDFRDKELCEGYGVLDPLQVPGKMLFSGEYAKLLQEIKALSGFDDLEEEAKN